MDEADDLAPVRSVARAADLLIILGSGPRPLREISAQVGLSKPTAHRILSSLKSRGMVMQDPLSGDYGLGPACFHLMSAIVNGEAGFVLDAKPALEALREETGETITVDIRAGLSRICIQEYPSPHAIRYISGVGSANGIYVGSAGKILLAFLPAEERERILRDLRLVQVTSSTITDLDVLRAELDKVRAAGFAVSHGERVAGAIGVSAPVLDASGRALASLSVLGPAERLAPRIAQAQEQVIRAAAEITKSMQLSLIGG